MGGWAQDAFVIVPDGTVLPCHAAQTIKGLNFENAAETPLAEIWDASPTFEKYRGFEWMSEPCKSCPRRELDRGGCRCQAFAVTGDAAQTDPACILSPHHDKLRNVAVEASAESPGAFSYRRL